MVIQKSSWRSAAFLVLCVVMPFVAVMVMAMFTRQSEAAIPGNHCNGLVLNEIGCTKTGRTVICDPCWSPGFPCATGTFFWKIGSCTIKYQVVGGTCGPCNPQ